MTEVRDKINDRITASRMVLETRRSARPLIVIVLFAAIAIAITGYLVSNISKTALSSSQTVDFAVNDASGVVAGQDQVRYKGIPVGTITGVHLTGDEPRLTVQLQQRYGAIYRNATAVLRPNTPLMDMYLDITNRGTPAAGRAGVNAPVPSSQTDVSVNVDDVLDTFRASTRTSLETMLDQLGNGLADRGTALREAFVDFVPLLEVAGRISDQLAGRAPLVRQLVHNTAVLTQTLGSRQQLLRRLLSEGDQAATTLAAQRTNLGAILAQLPPTLRTADTAFTALRGVLPPLDGALQSLTPVASALPGGLEQIRLISGRATPAISALQAPVRRLVPFAKTLVPLSSQLDTAFDALLPQVPVVDKVTTDLAECGPGLQNFFQFDMSTWKLDDFRTTMPRGNFAASARSLAVANPDPDTARAESCVNNDEIGPGPATAANEN
jgi:virulence factor Mce-like protein